MTKPRTTRRPASEAADPKSATTAEVKPKRQRGTALSEAGRGQSTTTTAGSPNAHPTTTPLIDAPATGTPRPQRQTKAALLRARLSDAGGVSLAALIEATGWQAHTLRAAMSGLRKEGLTLTRRREGKDTIYAIEHGGTRATDAVYANNDAAGTEA